MGDKRFKRRRQEVFHKPKLDRALGVLQDREDHDVGHTLVQMAARQRKDIDIRVAAPPRARKRRRRLRRRIHLGDQVHVLLAGALLKHGVDRFAEQRVETQRRAGLLHCRTLPAKRTDALDLVQVGAAPLANP